MAVSSLQTHESLLSLFLWFSSLLSLLCHSSSVHRPVTGVHLLRPILLPCWLALVVTAVVLVAVTVGTDRRCFAFQSLSLMYRWLRHCVFFLVRVPTLPLDPWISPPSIYMISSSSSLCLPLPLCPLVLPVLTSVVAGDRCFGSFTHETAVVAVVLLNFLLRIQMVGCLTHIRLSLIVR